MTFQSIGTLLSAITSLGVGWFVFAQNRRRLLNVLWGITNFFVAWWSIGNFFLLESRSAPQALFWSRAAIFGAALIPPLWLHFCCQLTQKSPAARTLFLLYLISTLSAFLSWHPLFITGVSPRGRLLFYPDAGPLYFFHVICFYLLLLPGFFRLGSEMIRSRGYKGKRLCVILVASLVGFASGLIHHFSCYQESVIPIGSQFMFLYPLIITLAIFRYHIFGIHLADKSPAFYEKVKLASERMAQETDPEKLVHTIRQMIVSHIHPAFCQLYFFNPRPSERLKNFVEWFSSSRQPLVREQIEFEMTKTTPPSPLQEQIYRSMNSQDIELCLPAFHQNQLMALILLGEKRSGLYSRKDLSFLMTLANDAATAIRNAQLIHQLQQILSGIIDAFAATVGKMDPEYTYEHIQRTRGIARRIVEKLNQQNIPLGMPEELFLAGILLHDVGKLFTPREILYKAGPLSEEEWVIMKKHPLDGADILERIQGLEELAKIARYHQERWDGRGYPQGLKGDEIPLGAQVAAVADAFDAMISDRPYRKGMSRAEAIEELKRHSGTQFSPRIVELMAALYEE